MALAHVLWKKSFPMTSRLSSASDDMSWLSTNVGRNVVFKIFPTPAITDKDRR